ncbi:MAG: hypothetical protein H7A46_20825 [Verrucomicrobiales bacterium]|nr:hypothetical protein [Verrucomicrobiales bacterium]
MIREFIRNIAAVCRVASVGHTDLQIAFLHNQGDFEDAMQIASALACGAEAIVSRDPGGFSKSPIPILNPGAQ